MIHGADIFKYSNGDIIDFSSNINPLGAPKALYDMIDENIKNIERYPDVSYRKLKSDIARFHKLDSSNIAVGSGALELIDNIIAESRFKKIYSFAPSFSEYKIRAKVHGKSFFEIDLKDDFSIDLDALDKIELDKYSLLIITNPNNPNGRLLIDRELDYILRLRKKLDFTIMLDEAFIEFTDKFYSYGELDGIYIIRAMTKFYAMPGLRLGYAISTADDIKKIDDNLAPWTISSLLEEAGEILFDEVYKTRTREFIKAERIRMMQLVDDIDGLETVKSDADFFLIKLNEISEDEIFRELLKRNILVRTCSSYSNMNGNYIRVAIKSASNNDHLIDSLKDIMNNLRKESYE